MYPVSAAGSPISLTFNTETGSAFYAFSSTKLTSELANRREPIASVFIPKDLHYLLGYKVEVNPNSISHSLAKDNDHLIELFGPPSGIIEGTIIEINVNAS